MKRYTVHLGIKLEPSLLAAVKQAAEQKRLHVSELVRAALLSYLARNEPSAPGHAAPARDPLSESLSSVHRKQEAESNIV